MGWGIQRRATDAMDICTSEIWAMEVALEWCADWRVLIPKVDCRVGINSANDFCT